MPAAISENRRERVKVKLQLSVPTQTIATETHVSRRSIQRFNKNLVDHGSTRAPKKDIQGRPRKITLEMERVCSFYTHLRF
jgi:transposase